MEVEAPPAETPRSAEVPQASPALVDRLHEYVIGVSGCLLALDGPEAAAGQVEQALKGSTSAQEAVARFVADARAPVLYLETFVPTGESPFGSILQTSCTYTTPSSGVRYCA
jgi:hypothetical protein